MRPCLLLSRTMALMVLVYVLQIGVEHIAGFTIHVGHPSHDLHKVATNSVQFKSRPWPCTALLH